MALKFLNNGYFAGKVGIGTESPTSPLTIKSNSVSSSSSGLAIQANGNTNNIFELAEKSTDGARLQMMDAGVTKIALYTDGTDNYINAGNVGIGTTSPITKLNVAGNIAVTATKAYRMYNAANTGWGQMSFIEADNRIEFNKGIQNSGVDWRLTENSANSFVCATQGNFGIGTTSPTQKLHVDGNARVTGAYYDSNNTPGTLSQILSSTATGTDWIDQDAIISAASKLVVIACKNTSGATITKGTPVYQTGTVGATDVIEVAEADSSDEDKMAAIGLLQTDIANNAFGNVVITGELLNFTTSPIDGVTPTTGDTIYVKPGGGLTLTKPTGLNFIQNVGLVGKVSGGSAGSITVSSIMRSNDVPTPLYVDHDNQRLGIGTDSPTRLLQLNSSGQTDLHLTSTSQGVGASDGMTVFLDSSGTGGLWLREAQSLRFATNSSEKMRIDSSGNVGINETSPASSRFTDSNNRILDISGNAVNRGGVITLRTSDNSKEAFLANDGGNFQIGMYTNNDVTFYTNNTERMRITSTGGISFGSTGTAYGTSGQILQSNGNASPTWIDGSAIPGLADTLAEVLVNGNTTGGTSISVTANDDIDFSDTSEARFGSNQDLIIKHTGTTGSVTNFVGNLNIVNNANSSDIRFFTDDGAGGIATYFELDGSSQINIFYQHTRTIDNKYLGAGSSLDLYMLHDGANSFIRNGTGDLTIEQQVDDKDIFFKSDNGSGGVTTYYYLDGSEQLNRFLKNILLPDNVYLSLGNSFDLKLYHDGTHSKIEDSGTGDLKLITNGTKINLQKGSTENLASFIVDGAVELYYDAIKKFETTSTGVTVTGDVQIDSALLSNQENTDVDTGTETVASVAIATYTAAFFDFVIKKTTNVRSGTVYACHDGTNVEFTETSTQDLGDTSDVTLSVDISGTDMRLRATTTSDDWSIKSLIRAI